MRQRALSWVAGIAATFGGAPGYAGDAPALAPITHLKDSDQLRAIRTMGRLYDSYVQRDIGVPDTMKPAGKVYDGLDETIEADLNDFSAKDNAKRRDKVHELCRRFEMDADELNTAHKVVVTGTSAPGEKQYTFFARKGGQEEVYATGVTRELAAGDKTGTYWSLVLPHKNSVRFGFEPGWNDERKATKRITWVERPVSENGGVPRPHFVMELRAKSTDWAWQRHGVYDQRFVEELLDKPQTSDFRQQNRR